MDRGDDVAEAEVVVLIVRQQIGDINVGVVHSERDSVSQRVQWDLHYIRNYIMLETIMRQDGIERVVAVRHLRRHARHCDQ